MAKPDPYGEADVTTPARGIDRRGVVLALGAAELVALVLMYAGSSWAVVLYQLLGDGLFLVAWLLAAAGWGALVLWPVRNWISAPEGRQTLAHDVSRGDAAAPPPHPPSRISAPEGRKNRGGGGWAGGPNDVGQFLRPSGAEKEEEEKKERAGEAGAGSPRLTPWAKVLRPSGAEEAWSTILPGEPGRGEGTVILVTAVALGLGVMGLGALALGLLGALNQLSASALLGGGLLTGAFLAWRRGALNGDLGAPVGRWLNAPAGWHWLWLLVLPMLAVALVGACVPPGLLWRPEEPHGYDVVEYHFQVPREWFEAGRIVPLKHNAFSYFPFGVEMHYLLAMHLRGGPWKGMYLAQLMHVAHVVLSVVAVYGLASSLTRQRAPAIAAALACAATPWLTLLAPIGFNEGGLLLYGALAIGWALRAIDAPPRAALACFALAGAMAGFACGVKLTGVPMLLVAVPVAVVVAAPRAIRSAWVMPLVGAVLFAPWALRNVAWAGNPVFPEAADVLGKGHFSDVQVERWKRAHSPRADQRSVGARLAAAGCEIVADWRFGYVPLAVGVVAAVVAFRDRRGRALVVLLGLLLLFWLGFTHLQGRFFVLAVPVLALLVAMADWRRWGVAVAGVLALSAVVSWALVHRQFHDKLYGPSGWAGVLGVADLNPELAQSVPADATLTLVGDAQAFYYQRPMAKLRYRTVFDVDALPGASVIDVWRGGGAEYLLVDPEELRRFHRTYWGIPDLPAGWQDRTAPVLIPSSGR
jgi:hypothetical protein